MTKSYDEWVRKEEFGSYSFFNRQPLWVHTIQLTETVRNIVTAWENVEKKLAIYRAIARYGKRWRRELDKGKEGS